MGHLVGPGHFHFSLELILLIKPFNEPRWSIDVVVILGAASHQDINLSSQITVIAHNNFVLIFSEPSCEKCLSGLMPCL